MTPTKNARIYPETIEMAEAASLPPYIDTTASRIDYLVRLGLKVVSIDLLPGPKGADKPIVLTVKEDKA